MTLEQYRIATWDVYRNNVLLATVNLLDSRTFQTFSLPGRAWAEPTSVLRFEIKAVYPGSKYEDTCLSELVLTCGN